MTAITSELKLRHRAMWASGDYPGMVETWLTPLGPRLVEACSIAPGMYVLDVAAGTGNASIPAAHKLAHVTASDLTVEWTKLERQVLEVTAFDRPAEFAEHFKQRYGPAIPTRAKAAAEGRADEFDAALNEFFENWNLGSPEHARFELEYLLAVGTKT